MEKLVTTSEANHAFLKGVKDCLPTVLGYLSIGFAAGVVEKTAGLSLMEIALMSLLLYAGSAQFIAAGMWVAGAPVMSIILTIFIVNLRYFLLSAALAPYFRHFPPKKNIVTGFLLTDETFGVAANHLAQKKHADYNWMLGLNVTAYLNWLLANVAGGYLGTWIERPEALGLDFALPAMFIGLLILQVLNQPTISIEITVILSAVIFTVIASMVVPPGIDVIIGTIFAACVGMVMEKWK
ncbi:MAG TPA: branched-chain amino acid ABC transporter permease [Bacillus bacterium]|uniref:Branched-chain amino acid ABC transporter permease n=1 Tax=Siminovitchia fordii TaxID=254759 RepID=A0ABQ4K0W0_9BACI|nr:AzlC family ABC transporter permease [Siminovitchia fordii]GIN19396.1 branched-chain amino acid ABC transporter permease [Siminovitchia fordii]HBZ10011.1 branched-chain amino acid ABC transporter permease [Bacillus sp. (in: firmicutes)]